MNVWEPKLSNCYCMGIVSFNAKFIYNSCTTILLNQMTRI